MRTLFLFPLLLFATETSVESGTALFNGSDLILSENVYLDHPLGKMWADRAHLIDYTTEKQTPFAHIELKQNVQLHFHQGARLACDFAHIDMEKEKGLVESETNVNFTDTVNGMPLTFASKQIAFSATEERINWMEASTGVSAHFLDGYHLSCHSAMYHLSPSPHVEATAQATEKCTIKRDADLIEGKTITVDLDQKTITSHNSLGYLESTQDPVRFGCGDLIWDNENDTLSLKNNAWVTSLQGCLSCEEEVTIEQKLRFGKREVARIWAQGRTLLTTGEQTLVSNSAIQINRDLLTAEALPAQLTTEHAIIIADSAHLTYTETEQGIATDTIRFSGNIYMRTKDPELPLKRALCDVLVYNPSTEEMILSSAQKGHVLYWDEKDDTRISASEIHINWPKVHGIGHVAFDFSEEEEARWFSKQKI